MKKPIHFLGACMGLGAQIVSTEEGPKELLSCEEFQNFVNISDHLVSSSLLHVEKEASLLSTLTNYNTRLKDEVLKSLEKNTLPIVVGGDHSIAVGTWFANIEYLSKRQKDLGLIWIDAHMDAHTFSSSPSKAYHGMPLASLIGYGPPLIQEHKNQKKLNPENLILIATRSYEDEERKFLQEHNARVYYMAEVSKSGFSKILNEAFSFLKSKGLEVGISFDFDALDPVHAPGVGSRETQGLCKEEFLKGFSDLNLMENITCLELVEYNPKLDQESKTKNLAFEILSNLLCSKQNLSR